MKLFTLGINFLAFQFYQFSSFDYIHKLAETFAVGISCNLLPNNKNEHLPITPSLLNEGVYQGGLSNMYRTSSIFLVYITLHRNELKPRVTLNHCYRISLK